MDEEIQRLLDNRARALVKLDDKIDKLDETIAIMEKAKKRAQEEIAVKVAGQKKILALMTEIEEITAEANILGAYLNGILDDGGKWSDEDRDSANDLADMDRRILELGKQIKKVYYNR